MRVRRRSAPLHRLVGPTAALLIALTTGCYDPPVRERVVLSLESDGRWILSVETTFKQGERLEQEENDRIQRAVDLYRLGRDPWLRGFERAGARDVRHDLKGDGRHPQGIARTGTIPDVESLVAVMPDAIANFRLIADPVRGTFTMRIAHIDIPESLRDNRRRLEREIEAFARRGYDLSERSCDLYDYLAEHPDRRRDVLQALDDEKKVAGLLTPEEAGLIRIMTGAFDRIATFGDAEGNREPPVMAGLSFSAFEHDFCVQLPVEASVLVGLAPDADGKGSADGATYCIPRLTLGELVSEIWPDADPPLGDGEFPQDDDTLREAPFSCHRYDDETELERKLWDDILPLPTYEITWSPAPPSQGGVDQLPE